MEALSSWSNRASNRSSTIVSCFRKTTASKPARSRWPMTNGVEA